MRLVVISDTHGNHEDLGILERDVLIHCGDFCDGFKNDPGDVEAVGVLPDAGGAASEVVQDSRSDGCPDHAHAIVNASVVDRGIDIARPAVTLDL